MKENTDSVILPEEVHAVPELVSRGLLREQSKRRRLRSRVVNMLIVGIDLAREQQAVSYHAGEIIGGVGSVVRRLSFADDSWR